jgi:predicted lipoprotein with Yx(FWY)xxD motif
MMKNLVSSIAAAAIATLTAAVPVHADHMKVRIHNNTGLTLYRFYSTNSGAT